MSLAAGSKTLACEQAMASRAPKHSAKATLLSDLAGVSDPITTSGTPIRQLRFSSADQEPNNSLGSFFIRQCGEIGQEILDADYLVSGQSTAS